MPTLAVAVFGLAALLVGYVLVGYPVLLAIMSRRFARPFARRWSPRSVSVLLPVHNGEKWISQKLRSIAALDYPRELLQVIVVDDGSSDDTAAAAKAFRELPVEVISIARSGKAEALNAGRARARGEILLFTDVRQPLERGSLRHLVECFADPDVGVVSGELVILDGASRQEANIGLYWRYEKWIRRHLSRLHSVPGATGCIYAMRRELAVPLPSNTLLDDVYLPLAAFFRGYRIVFDERARAFDYPTALRSEFRRKVRTLAGNYQVIGKYPRLLLPTSRLWLHFVSHKVGRLMLPFAMVAMAISTVALPAPWRNAVGTAQLIFYGLVLGDSWIPEVPYLKRLSSMARTFVVMMAAAFCAPFYLRSKSKTVRGWAATDVRPAIMPARD